MSPAMLYGAFALYGLFGTLVAAMARRGVTGQVESYFLANRRLGGVVSALSYAAATYSAFMMVGLAGLTYRGGVGALGFEFIYLAGLSLVAFFGPHFWRAGHRWRLVSPAELLAVRYASPVLGMVVAGASVLFLIPYSSAQLTGVALLMEGMSHGAIPFQVGLLLAAALSVAWAWMGGLKSVAWTQAVQALFTMGTALFVTGVVLARVGGLGGLFARLAQDAPELLVVPGNGYFSWQTFLGLSLPWFFFALSNPQVSQRLFAPRDLGVMRCMLLGFLAFGFIYTLTSILWGFAGRVLLPGLDNPDLVTPQLLGSGYVPPVAALLAMVGIMAAAIDTVNPILLTLSSMVARDLFRPLRPQADDRAQLVVGKVAILAIGVLALLFANLRAGLVAVLSVASSAGLLVTVPALIGAFYWQRGTAAGALAGIVAGGAVVVVMQFTGLRPLGLWPGVWGLTVSAALFVGVSLLTRPEATRAREFAVLARQPA
ncbi:sodium:solute symporter family protein [Carboxydochorda subterranea]|uniref:Sodium:solute symporter family protein n=1 Tax=Carboxydichorda subterranea TaxID=3109565 RepID=A0ABZ1BXB3_9FIRM|nr:sodium:solute symporter family protein [Limnochorda sp. L945t]WRP17427.1 sodium:solute symporter family protein [Limnochorda sp. L945t]